MGRRYRLLPRAPNCLGPALSTSAARGDDLKCRPLGIFLSPAEKVNQHANISDDLFLVIHPKNEKISPFFTENVTIFNVNLTIFT